ncbi:GreA/GreB family elongation factor [Kiloniella laminariae]|uniref:GreA/GreB family elongation factor n=1 Tax=Kiloniella laminariae TaxID=454162 RepID=A0ABT4LL80_9PROT|nr:GreA/GreB family elongation factor [Kiloniella laminariae]MCZ4281874.1 GreA/GreB family elongation factor [Kiloniella laminariae]
MSRAFVKEPDGDQVPDDQPELPISLHPNFVTVEGLAQLREQLEEARRNLSHLRTAETQDMKNKMQQGKLGRDIRYLEQRLSSAILVDAAKQPEKQVAFGAWILLEDTEGKEYRYRIVGEDEASPAENKISWVSPLAKAALDAEVGELIVWQRPVGNLELELLALSYTGPCRDVLPG